MKTSKKKVMFMESNKVEKNLVSVIMGVYNCEKTIVDAVESILNQTYSEIQFIICDDCSTDNTYKILEEYKNKYDDRIVLLRNDSNHMLAYSLNRCLEKATGYYIARMDGDDISTVDRIKKQVDYLKNNKEIDLCGTAMQRFDDNGFGSVDKAVSHPNKDTMLKGKIPFNHATICTYKKVYDELNGYVVSKYTRRAEDRNLWYRFFNLGFKGENIEEPLYLVRENIDALKRRTIKDRWYGYMNNLNGYRLLKASWRDYLVLSIMTLIKMIVPVRLVYFYRNIEKNIQK